MNVSVLDLLLVNIIFYSFDNFENVILVTNISKCYKLIKSYKKSQPINLQLFLIY